MRTIKLILVLLCLIGVNFSIYGTSNPSTISDPGEILILPQNDIPDDAPRSPVLNPFYAYLINGFVLLGSNRSIGDVYVALTSTAGDNYSTVFDTSEGSIIIPISGFAGDYTLLLTDAFGAQFVGEFEID